MSIDYPKIYRECSGLDDFCQTAIALGATEEEAVNIYYELTSKYAS